MFYNGSPTLPLSPAWPDAASPTSAGRSTKWLPTMSCLNA